MRGEKEKKKKREREEKEEEKKGKEISRAIKKRNSVRVVHPAEQIARESNEIICRNDATDTGLLSKKREKKKRKK